MKLDLSEDDIVAENDLLTGDGDSGDSEHDEIDVVLSKRDRDRDYTEMRRRIEQNLERRRLIEELGIFDNDWSIED